MVSFDAITKDDGTFHAQDGGFFGLAVKGARMAGVESRQRSLRTEGIGAEALVRRGLQGLGECAGQTLWHAVMATACCLYAERQSDQTAEGLYPYEGPHPPSVSWFWRTRRATTCPDAHRCGCRRAGIPLIMVTCDPAR